MSGAFDKRYTEYQIDRSGLRKLVRRAYLRSARAKLSGPTLDFGCGIGELLETLPAGSMGLEYNQATVAHCRGNGLDVAWYDGFEDDWSLSVLDGGRRFQSMVISHVLEHLEAPMSILQRLLVASERLSIEQALVIVPGRSGFRIDETHRTFVDLEMLSEPGVVEGTGFRLAKSSYFPLDLRPVGDWFPHHELQALFVRR